MRAKKRNYFKAEKQNERTKKKYKYRSQLFIKDNFLYYPKLFWFPYSKVNLRFWYY